MGTSKIEVPKSSGSGGDEIEISKFWVVLGVDISIFILF